MKSIGTSLVTMFALVVCVVVGGCGKSEDAKPREWTEGRVQVSSKHACVKSLDAQIVRSTFDDEKVSETTREAIVSSLAAQAGKPVLLVRLNLSIDELSKALREGNGDSGSLKAEDICASASSLKLIPVLPEGGTMEVVDGMIFLHQDFVYHLPESAVDLELIVGEVSLAKFSF
ncbi:MAG: hypothetical protein HQ581_18400 [Planctomycetes bacterium]|nr:hypothetical protein [Planctomycetota bacterium]